MKLFNKCLALGLALSLFSCSSDEPGATGGDNVAGNKDGIYSTVRFNFPKTRSTEKEGVEVGQNVENNIGSILIIVAQKANENSDYGFLTFALNDAPLTNATTNTYTVTFQDKEVLYNHATETVYVFAYCNPTQEIRDKICGTLAATGKYEGGLSEGETFTDEIFKGDPSLTWQDNGFLMTSVGIVTKKLGSTEELQACNTPGNAFDLGTIDVMRTMSRFDFRDASDEKNLTYEIKDPNDDSKVQGKVKLTGVAMFNLADKFYYLPRVGTTSASTLCPGFDGMEVTDENFVISAPGRSYLLPYPTEKLDHNNLPKLEWMSLETLLGRTEDNDEGWGETIGKEDKEGYHIWRYATENTIMGADNDTSNTTGYVFEAEIIPNEDFGNVDGEVYQTMYLYNNLLYANATKIYEAVQKSPVSTLATAFNNAFTVVKNAQGNVTSITPKEDDVLEAMGFIAYKPVEIKDAEGKVVDHKYYCYYFAYNTHNEDGKPYEVGNMEYATVRNNVYKLAVTTIKKFGTLTPPEEVETWDTYFTLKVMVKPWVVRINNIEF